MDVDVSVSVDIRQPNKPADQHQHHQDQQVQVLEQVVDPPISVLFREYDAYMTPRQPGQMQ